MPIDIIGYIGAIPTCIVCHAVVMVSRALAAVNDANEVDMFYRRLDPVGGGFSGNCCGTCTQVRRVAVYYAL